MKCTGLDNLRKGAVNTLKLNDPFVVIVYWSPLLR